MDIYIKPEKKYTVNKLGAIKIKDIANVYAPKEIMDRVNNLTIIKITENVEKCYLISVIDIINLIDKAQPGHTISNVGEIDTIVEFKKNKDKISLWKIIKIAIVCLILVAGSSTAIMCFHTEVQMGTVLENYYYIFFGEKVSNPAVIDIPYSLGLALGIIVFYNHIGGKKLTSDPTPIEVEMTQYDDDVTSNIIDTLSSKENKQC
jgi:stage V sporulation protein AA